MAIINQDDQASSNSKAARKVSHYINVSIPRPDGTMVRLGAISVYDGGDKAQRTLIDAVLGERKIDPISFDVVIDVRTAEKSTDLDDVEGWGTRTDGFVTQKASA